MTKLDILWAKDYLHNACKTLQINKIDLKQSKSVAKLDIHNDNGFTIEVKNNTLLGLKGNISIMNTSRAIKNSLFNRGSPLRTPNSSILKNTMSKLK